ncbi:hypothetical protein [Rhodoferax bucti]|uniref:hypothetical protein n=1 Tax=Rhodoferax bucti TaxID=2576305 RepID=UPI0011081C4E|nr:hypothetical protein [Rhodoferax bucti]
MSKDFNRFLIPGAAALGAFCVLWISAGFVGTSHLALGMTLLIGVVYATGIRELQRFRASTAELRHALNDIPQGLASLGDWLERVPAPLQHSVRLRIEGERTGLPGPALTPYLVGLLVMLGMLGTFLGMVLTFKGAVFALEGSADLQAIRAALAAPIKGLGLSFGTSVAGVATSAMLGLVSALCRRERLDVARLLDSRIATVLRPFSLAHQREASLQALQQQSQALPGVAEQLQRLMEHLEQRHEALSTRLEAQQQAFHQEVSGAYTGLAQSVAQTLQDSLLAGTRQAGEAMVPVVQTAMHHVATEAQAQHQRTSAALHAQLSEMQASFQAGTQSLTADWAYALERSTATLQAEWQRTGAEALAQQQAMCKALDASAATVTTQAAEQAATAMAGISRVLERAETLVSARQQSEADWAQQQHARMDQLAALWRTELAALRTEETARGEAAAERLGALTTQLRTEMTRLDERDTAALQERHALMERLHGLLQSAEATTQGQRAAIDTLVTTAGHTLVQVQQQFAQTLALQTDKAESLGAHLSGSAIELSSLGNSFQHAVELFVRSNEQLVHSLQGMEAAVGQSAERSDEQLAYYVGQAREVIDLSLSSQKAVLEDLRKLRSPASGPTPVNA